MQKTTWMRLAFGAVLVNAAVAGALAAGCSGDDTTTKSGDASANQSVAEGGADSSDAGSDVRANDASSDADATSSMDGDAGPASIAKVYLVHASPDAPPLRFCFGLPMGDGGVTILSIPAAPDTSNPAFPFPGLFPGFGGPLDTHGLDPSAATFNVYAINASAIADQSADGGPEGGAEAKCTDLLGATGAGGLVSPSDFFYAGTFQQGMFARGTTWLVALVGCVPGESASAALCPASYSADAGNIHFLPWQLDKTTAVDGTQIGAQFAQASSAWDNVLAASGGAVTAAGFAIPASAVTDAAIDAVATNDAGNASDGAAVVADSGDASTDAPTDATDGASSAVDASAPASSVFVPIVLDAKYGELKPALLKGVSGVTYDGKSAFVAQALTADGGTIAVRTLWPLVPTASQPLSIQTLTWGANTPNGAALANGGGFVFVLVGNPAETNPTVDPVDGGPAAPGAGGVFNGRFPHILAFPTK